MTETSRFRNERLDKQLYIRLLDTFTNYDPFFSPNKMATDQLVITKKCHFISIIRLLHLLLTFDLDDVFDDRGSTITDCMIIK